MNPELPSPQIQPERQPVTPDHGEHLPSQETVGERSPEREQNMQQVDRQAAPPLPPPIVPLPPAPVPVPSHAQQTTNDTAGPTLASDDDLIEKEWVDKAKAIIAQTQNDPYRREQEVTKLQADYLRKRYGKELGTAD